MVEFMDLAKDCNVLGMNSELQSQREPSATGWQKILRLMAPTWVRVAKTIFLKVTT